LVGSIVAIVGAANRSLSLMMLILLKKSGTLIGKEIVTKDSTHEVKEENLLFF
jgi:hypothetical protein